MTRSPSPGPRLLAMAMILLSAAGCRQSTRQDAAVDASDFGRRIIKADLEPQNWLSTGRTYDEARGSPLDQINVGNAGKLGLAWSYDLDTNRGQEATPLAVDGVLYTTSAWSKVQAFDAVSGKLLWQFDPHVPGATAAKACCDVVNRGAAYWDGKVIVGTLDGRLIAIGAKTGKQIWSTVTVDQTKKYTITGAPRVVKGKVIIGNGGADMGVRGYVSAYDADTGALAWRFYTVPGQPGKADNAASDAVFRTFAGKTWSGDWWRDSGGGGGGTVWDSMAYDPELDLLYIGVGNAAFWNKKYRSGADDLDNLFVSSIIALRPATGEYVWHYQETPGDSWDYTATQNMILTNLTIDGRPRKVLMQAPKNGFFYVLDRATGKLISAKPYIPLNWADGIDPGTGRPNVNPAALYYKTNKPWLAMPGSLGGHNWMPMAFNKGTGLVYIPAQQIGGAYITDPGFKPSAIGLNVGIDMAAFSLPEDAAEKKAITATLKGKLIAWDPVAQKEVWSAPNPGFWNGGVLTTAGNLVVQGDNDGFLNIYDAANGRKLWTFDAGSPIVAAPITYSVAGKQYVTVMVGYGGVVGLLGGELNWSRTGPRHNKSRVLTFALGGGATLPPRETIAMATPEPPPAFGDASTIAAGGNMFNRTCAACHGGGAKSAGVIPDLRRSGALGSAEAWQQIVGQGALEDQGMPNFAGTFDARQIEAMRAYVVGRARKDR